jgi:multicomponent Na+:H+ antiporter subunit E
VSKILSAFVFTFLVWIAVTWAFDAPSLVIGALLAAGVAIGVGSEQLNEVPLLLLPQRLIWALLYMPVLLLYVIKANLDVAWRVLHPALPIRPGIVKTRTTLKSTGARVLLANSITLTPGTLSVDLVDDVLYIHRIYVPEQDPDADMQRSMKRFETFLRRIFE